VPFTSNVVSSNPAQVSCTTLCDKDCQLLATGRWFSLGTAVSSTNEITEILLLLPLILESKSCKFSIFVFVFLMVQFYTNLMGYGAESPDPHHLVY
jgi:hypothetical protein